MEDCALALQFYVENDYPDIGVVESFGQSSHLLSAIQAAARMQVSRDTVYRLVTKGHLLAYRPSQGGLRIPREEVDAYVKSLKKAVA